MNNKSTGHQLHRALLLRRIQLPLLAALTALAMGLFVSDTPPAFAASYTVDTTSDASLTACTGAAADCSLRGAIANANANGGGDTITFDSTIDDKSITTPDSTNTVGSEPSLVLDSSGNPVIAYYYDSGNDLKVLHCGDPNCSSGNSITSPDTTGDVGRYPSIALDPSTGVPVISYFDVTNTRLKVLRCGDANCTSGNTFTTPDTGGNKGRYSSIALDSNRYPVISHYELGNTSVRLVRCGSLDCSVVTNTAIVDGSGGDDTGSYTSLELDGSDFPVISYFDATGGRLILAHCGNANCTSGNAINIVDDSGADAVGSHTSLELDASGFPVISYYDATNTNLKVAHCGNADCTSGNSVLTVDSTTDDVGRYTSLALNASGNPVVSYFKFLPTADLKLLVCGSPNCTSGNSILNPDPGGFVGNGTSLVMDGSGSPVVAYYAGNSGADLKVLHCTTANCAASGGVGTITLGSSLPTLSNNGDTIDATTTGVAIAGSVGITCFNISGNNNTIVGIESITGCGGGPAIEVSGSSNTIGGTNVAELTCTGSADDDGDGVVNDGCAQSGATVETGANCLNGTDDDLVDSDAIVNDGCPARGQGIRISSSNGAIRIAGEGADTNAVIGNWIGLDPTLSSAATNVAGIYVEFGADGNVIGGSTVGARNVISGHATRAGVAIYNAGTTGTVVKGNYIGTDAAGSAAVSNAVGVAIGAGASGTTIGGTSSGDRNVISGNTGDGVKILAAAEEGANCGDAADSDNDGFVNDGCPQAGATAEAGAQCANSTDDDAVDADGKVNDGCPVMGPTSSNVILGNYIGLNAAGTAALANGDGIEINGSGASSNTVGGTTASARNIISGNTSYGVNIAGSGATSNLVQGNYIGTNVAGTAAIPNGTGIYLDGAPSNTIGGAATAPGTAPGNVIAGDNYGIVIKFDGADSNKVWGNIIGLNAAGTTDITASGDVGVWMTTSPDGNEVGGMATNTRNIISGYARGVAMHDSGTTGNLVYNNYLGTDITGTVDRGNSSHGVSIGYGASSNIIGAAGAGNVISGNDQEGIRIGEGGGDSPNNVVRGNRIGTNAPGTAALANTGEGIYIEGSSGTVIGGSAAGQGNVISANTAVGIWILGAAATGSDIKGNYVGTDLTGSVDLGNGSAGIKIQVNFSSGTVGGSGAGEGNIISGNSTGGLDIQGSDGAVVYGNYIGTNPAGANLGNTSFGIELDSNSNGNYIGGTTAGQGNTIAFNTTDGVVVYDSTATGNRIRGNSIYSNGELGIDLNPNGVTANDAGDGDSGANNLENFPIITSATYSGGTLTVSGTLDNTDNAGHDVDVYLTDSVDGSGNGEGRQYLGSTTATAPSGSWSLVLPGAPAPAYAIVTATSTDQSPGNTSEFSAAFNNTDFDGDGISSTTDNCPVDANPIQINNDGDGLGDVCDSAVRNRYSVYQSSITADYTTAPGETIPPYNRAYHSWDYAPGPSIDVGAGVGRIDVHYRVGVGNGPCTTSVAFAGGSGINIYNATLDNSPGNLTTNPYGDDDSDTIPNGVERYPAFLNTYLDPERLTGIDADGDGSVDEDSPDGVNNDADSFTDEDGAGTPVVPHARYFGKYSSSSYMQVLVFEEVANSRYRVEIVSNDPTAGPSFLSTNTYCGPLELRTRIDDTSTANGVVPGGDTIQNQPANGTALFKFETSPAPDADGDGVPNVDDKCAQVADPTQADTDSDNIGNACDPTSGVDTNAGDHDLDGWSNSTDNCPTVANASQAEGEGREPLAFGLGWFRDGVGTACDRNPLGYDLGNVLRTSHYTDAICVGLTDADGDGWCSGNDPTDTGAAVTPEGSALAGDIGTCTNGVDDDGDTLVDFADTAGCPDQDGDRIRDAEDVCPQAADPLQLDTDLDVSGGDACGEFSNGEPAHLATLEAYPTRANAHGDLRGRVVEPAPAPLHQLNSGYVEYTDPDWTFSSGSGITNGAIRDVVNTVTGVTLAPSNTCNYPLPVTFTLVDASTDYSDQVSTETGYAPLVADTNPANGLSDGVDKMPSFLATAKVLDDDADGSVDEDPADAVDNDGDGRTDEDRAPIARMFAQTYPPHATQVLNVMVYAPVQKNNDGDGSTNEDPVDGIDNDVPPDGRIDEDPPDGYKAFFILGDPSINPLVGGVRAFCTPFEARHTRLAITVDNPTTAGNEGGAVSIRNSASGSTELFATEFTSQSDADGDLIENSLDTCALLADNDLEGGPDNTDTTPWNPRLVSPPGDPDGNGVPAACEPVGGGGGGFQSGGYQSQSTICVPADDCDGDGLANTADNCFTIANLNQRDSDADGIGDVCDSRTTFPDGAVQTVTNGTPVCTVSLSVLDADGDGYCAGVDVNDTSDAKEGGFPEFGAFSSLICNDTFDNDGDWITAPNNPGDGVDAFANSAPAYPGAPADSGCGDSDGDQVLDRMDNCPQDANPSQLDTDNDSATADRVGQQPFLRTATGDPAGDPVEVLGQPFLRTDKWGGDACDPDKDGDYLPNLSEPAGTCTTGNSAPALNADCDGDLMGDLAEYAHSSLCVTTEAFACPGGTDCLHPINNNFNSSTPDWKRHSDAPAPGSPAGSDYLFDYAEALFYVQDSAAGLPGPNPCAVDPAIQNNADNDTDVSPIDSLFDCPDSMMGCRDGMERWLGTDPNVKCAANTGVNNEPLPDRHPADFNDSKSTNISDIVLFGAAFNSPFPNSAAFNRRYDLNADGAVSISDVVTVGSLFNKSCVP